MPISVEKIPPIRDEIERHEDKNDDYHYKNSDDEDTNLRHHHAMTPPEQDFSYLKRSSHPKRSVHYDTTQIDEFESRPLRTNLENDPAFENVLRRRYIAHWGLPGM